MTGRGSTYLFFGYGAGSEYVLTPLADRMARLGHTVVELDLMATHDPDKVLKGLIGREVVFVTSAHLFLDHHNMHRIYRQPGRAVSALEVMDLLQPARSYYYPHDLVTPVLDEDSRWLSLFDALLSPLPHLGHLERFTRVVEVGWVKKTKWLTPRPANRPPRIVHTLSNFSHFRSMGLDRMYEFWRPLWELGVEVKLPYWPGSDECEAYLKERSIGVVPAATPIFDLLDQCDVAITNGNSSVNVEASLSGRSTINILDATLPKTVLQRSLAGFPGLQVLSVDQGAAAVYEIVQGRRVLPLHDDRLHPFDFDTAIQTVTRA
ncbi:MAG: hypothetical protein ACOY94_21215 [Bacillota bacterium]